MIQPVRKQLRESPVTAELTAIVELLNKEHAPLIREARERLNELILALNPGDVSLTAGAGPTEYLQVTIGTAEYAIPLYPRS